MQRVNSIGMGTCAMVALSISALAVGGRSDEPREVASKPANQNVAPLEARALSAAEMAIVEEMRSLIQTDRVEENPAFAPFDFPWMKNVSAGGDASPTSSDRDAHDSDDSQAPAIPSIEGLVIGGGITPAGSESGKVDPFRASEVVPTLRGAAQRLDEAAQILENADLYQWADQISRQANQMRKQAREVRQQLP